MTIKFADDLGASVWYQDEAYTRLGTVAGPADAVLGDGDSGNWEPYSYNPADWNGESTYSACRHNLAKNRYNWSFTSQGDVWEEITQASPVDGVLRVGWGGESGTTAPGQANVRINGIEYLGGVTARLPDSFAWNINVGDRVEVYRNDPGRFIQCIVYVYMYP